MTLGLLFALPLAKAGVFPYEIHSTTLENGLTVHVVPMPSPGIVSYYTWMAVGSRDEVEEGRTGFAHFFEHLMFFGTEKLGGATRERALFALGADENAWTWFDETVYHATLSKDGLPWLIDAEADRFMNLHLTPDDIEKESGAVYGEFRKGRSDPDGRLVELLYATAFTTHTYKHDTIGYEADIAAMPTAFEHSQQFFARHYRPENARILVVGDVTPDVVEKVRSAYAGWARGADERPTPTEEPPQEGLRTAHLDWEGPAAPRLALAWKIPAHNPDDLRVAALEMADNLLFGESGPLERRLVREEGLAYEVWGGRDALVDPGLFAVVVTLQDPAGAERAEAIVREEIGHLATEIPIADLERTRQHERYEFLTSLDNPSDVAHALGWHLRRGGTPDSIDRFYAVYDALTPDAVSAVVRDTFVDERLTKVTLAEKLP